MKFGKLIADAQQLSVAAWRPGFMDYKALKQVLKAAGPKPAGVLPTALASQLATSPCEVEFFTMLKGELTRVTEFYTACETEMLTRYKDLVASLTAYKDRLRGAGEADAVPMLTSVVSFYMDLLLLENFAVINYCGFGKILKKHDKVTGYITKEAYMQRMVNPQEFTSYPRLMKMLRHTEQSYQLLLHTFPSASRPGLLTMESQLRLKQLEAVKAQSAAQKASETASVTAGSEVGAPNTGGGSPHPTAAHSAPPAAAGSTHSGSKGVPSSPHSRLAAVELSAAQALVSVASDAMSKPGSVHADPPAPKPTGARGGMQQGGGYTRHHAAPAMYAARAHMAPPPSTVYSGQQYAPSLHSYGHPSVYSAPGAPPPGYYPHPAAFGGAARVPGAAAYAPPPSHNPQYHYPPGHVWQGMGAGAPQAHLHHQ